MTDTFDTSYVLRKGINPTTKSINENRDNHVPIFMIFEKCIEFQLIYLNILNFHDILKKCLQLKFIYLHIPNFNEILKMYQYRNSNNGIPSHIIGFLRAL